TLAPHTPAVSISGKGITLQGAGIGQTVITDTTGSDWGESVINVQGMEGHPFRITGFSFVRTGPSSTGIYIQGDCKNFRVDHNSFSSEGEHTSIYAWGYTYGVIDHNDFFNGRVLVFDAISGEESWQRPLTLGSVDAVYVEDNYYITDIMLNVMDSNGGARWVFRYNTVVNSNCEAHGLQNNNQRGTFSYELYENIFTTADNGKNNWVAFYTRGGTGVLFNNQVINAEGNPYNDFAAIQDNRSCDHAITYWGPCDGTSACDGNTPGMSGYPCRDQIGRSTDFGDSQVHPQALEPLYAWNNTFDGNPVAIESRDICDLSLEHVVEGRDFINGVRPGYTPYTYPHPLTQDLVLTSTPADGIAYLDWTVASWTYLPPTTTWRLSYYSETLPSPVTRTGIVSTTRAYTLTELTNYEWYTVTLNAMTGSTPWLTDTVRVMPTNRLVYLPLVPRD
ncbi:MAG: hypothetical protein JXA14_09495, partial [Anaerolineae bacterium]|nr:hypothetical protein [Anaerolineae bacterium]